jgi:transcriptional regulator with XRE-family HTH domain
MKREVLLKKVGKRAAALREKAGISQSELARLCQKDRQSIHAFEKGEYNASLVYLSEIAIALNITLADLVDFD